MDFPKHEDRASECYSMVEAAKQLGVSRNTVFALVADRSLGSIRIGRRRLVPRIEIERFVASRLREGGFGPPPLDGAADADVNGPLRRPRVRPQGAETAQRLGRAKGTKSEPVRATRSLSGGAQ